MTYEMTPKMLKKSKLFIINKKKKNSDQILHTLGIASRSFRLLGLEFSGCHVQIKPLDHF